MLLEVVRGCKSLTIKIKKTRGRKRTRRRRKRRRRKIRRRMGTQKCIQKNK
jgi:hypothetical protein